MFSIYSLFLLSFVSKNHLCLLGLEFITTSRIALFRRKAVLLMKNYLSRFYNSDEISVVYLFKTRSTHKSIEVQLRPSCGDFFKPFIPAKDIILSCSTIINIYIYLLSISRRRMIKIE